jgi:hypothetical protein
MAILLTFSTYLLAVFFAVVGVMKLSKNKKNVAKQFSWIRDFKPATITFICFLEILLAFGLVGPQLIKTAFVLTQYAAIGICVLMVLAGMYHSRKRDYKSFVLNIVIFILAFFIAYNWKLMVV